MSNNIRRNSPQTTRPAQSRVQQLVNQGVDLARRHGRDAIRVGTQASSAFNSFRSARDMYRGYTSVDTSNSRLAQANRVRRLASPVVSTANNLRRLPGQVTTASRDIRTALRTRRSEDLGRANRSTRDVVSNARSIAEAAPQIRVATRVAARNLQSVRAVQALRAPAQRIIQSSGSRIAQRLVTRTAASTVGRTAARAGARFVPGANIAIAALDTAEAVRTWNDPNVSRGRRWANVVTAAGSIAAATNIPVVSQIGAGVSTVSSVVGSFFR